MNEASSSATLRVRLLSIAQNKQAAATAADGARAPKSTSCGHDKTSAPPTISAMPAAMRRSKFSRNTNQAISAVNTPSRFSNSDAPDAGICISPHNKQTGAMMPPDKTAPASQPMSARPGLTGWWRRKPRHAQSPRPDPRYSKPASSHGLTGPSKIFAKGVPAPNNNAAANAATTPGCLFQKYMMRPLPFKSIVCRLRKCSHTKFFRKKSA